MSRKKKKKRKKGKPFSKCPVKQCPKCKIIKPLTRHHVYPKCHFGNMEVVELICNECHCDLEYFIQKIEGLDNRLKRIMLPELSYLNIYKLFISL